MRIVKYIRSLGKDRDFFINAAAPRFTLEWSGPTREESGRSCHESLAAAMAEATRLFQIVPERWTDGDPLQCPPWDGTLLCLRSSVIVTLLCHARFPLNSLSDFGKRAREKTDDICVTALCCSYVCVSACELERSLTFIRRNGRTQRSSRRTQPPTLDSRYGGLRSCCGKSPAKASR
jgi:hypothetical protein